MNVIGHEDVVRELRALSAGAEPPHALLFAGPEQSGRKLLALTLAQLLNCERAAAPGAAAPALFDMPPTDAGGEVPCGVCRPCRLIADGAHPDVILLGPGDTLCKPRDGESHARHPDSRDIRICQVRGLIELASRFPFEARQRVIVIDPADRLGREASNTILKTLEEPPGHTVFALLSAAPEVIIETVLSRCRRVDVRPVPRAVIEESAHRPRYGAGRCAGGGRSEPRAAREGAHLRSFAEPDGGPRAAARPVREGGRRAHH